MKKIELSTLIEDKKSFREIARIKNVSLSTVRYWTKKYKLKSSHGRKKGYLCKHCGETKVKNFVKMSNDRRHKSVCKKCHSNRSVKRLRRNKELAVQYKGGKCTKCDYSKCLGALDFHHRDPKKKDPSWKLMKAWKFERIIKEIDKCDLLCSNCHRELHYPGV